MATKRLIIRRTTPRDEEQEQDVDMAIRRAADTTPTATVEPPVIAPPLAPPVYQPEPDYYGQPAETFTPPAPAPVAVEEPPARILPPLMPPTQPEPWSPTPEPEPVTPQVQPPTFDFDAQQERDYGMLRATRPPALPEPTALPTPPRAATAPSPVQARRAPLATATPTPEPEPPKPSPLAQNRPQPARITEPSGDLTPDQAALMDPDKWSLCGPVAAIAFARAYGRAPTVAEAKRLAREVGWTPNAGMAGPQSQVALLQRMGVASTLADASAERVAADVQSGNPVIISTPQHYFVAERYDPKTGKFYFGTSGTVLSRTGGKAWMTLEEVQRVGKGLQGAIYLDNPATPTPSPTAGSSASVTPEQQAERDLGTLRATPPVRNAPTSLVEELTQAQQEGLVPSAADAAGNQAISRMATAGNVALDALRNPLVTVPTLTVLGGLAAGPVGALGGAGLGLSMEQARSTIDREPQDTNGLRVNIGGNEIPLLPEPGSPMDMALNAVPALGAGYTVPVRGIGRTAGIAADMASNLLGGPNVASLDDVVRPALQAARSGVDDVARAATDFGERLAGIDPATGRRASETLGVNLGNAFASLMKQNDTQINRLQRQAAQAQGDEVLPILDQIEQLSAQRDRLLEIGRQADELQGQIAGMEAALNESPATKFVNLIAKNGQFKGEVPGSLTVQQFRQLTGKGKPANVNLVGGRVPTHIALDEIANDLGMTTDQLQAEIQNTLRLRQQVENLKGQLRELDNDAKMAVAPTGTTTPGAPAPELQTQEALPGFGMQRKAVRDGQAPVKQGAMDLGTPSDAPPAPSGQTLSLDEELAINRGQMNPTAGQGALPPDAPPASAAPAPEVPAAPTPNAPREVNAVSPENLSPSAQAGKPVRFAAGKKLTKTEREEVLASVVDVYIAKKAPKETKGIGRNGEEIVGYAYSPELFEKSDITGRLVRRYIMLPDGRKAHPSELFPELTDAVLERRMSDAIATARQQAALVVERNRSREARIAPATDDAKGEANRRYLSTNRKIWYSYFARDADGNTVRVDGTDPDDVRFYSERGFQPISQPVPPTPENAARAAEHIEQLLRNGQAVPDNVLADYPDLAAKYGRGTAPAPMSTAPEPTPALVDDVVPPASALPEPTTPPLRAADDALPPVEEASPPVEPVSPTPPVEPPTAADAVLGDALPRRRFTETVGDAGDTAPEVRAALADDPRSYYEPLANQTTAARAEELVRASREAAISRLMDSDEAPDALTTAAGQLLIKQAQEAGDWRTAIEYTEQLAKRLTTAGQGIQAVAMYGRLTPEGILRFAERVKRNGAVARGKMLAPRLDDNEIARIIEAVGASDQKGLLTPTKAKQMIGGALNPGTDLTDMQAKQVVEAVNNAARDAAKATAAAEKEAAKAAARQARQAEREAAKAVEQAKQALARAGAAQAQREAAQAAVEEAQRILLEARKAAKKADADVLRIFRQADRLDQKTAAQELTPERVKRAIELKLGSEGRLTEEEAARFTERARALQDMAEGREKVVATAKLLRDIRELEPVGFWRKVATAQTIFLLLNPKTMIRNLGGNTLYLGLENLSQGIAAGVDAITSMKTGERTLTLSRNYFKGQAGGFRRGAVEGTQEAWQGIDTLGNQTAYGLPQGRTFRSGVRDVAAPGLSIGQRAGRVVELPLHYAEQALNLAMRAPDRAFYQGAFDGELANQAAIRAANEGLTGTARAARETELLLNPTEEMIERAHLTGLTRTFQDDSRAAVAFVGLKMKLNELTGSRDFGLGDLLLKFPKVPANLLKTAIEYSPIGFTRTVYEGLAPLAFSRQFNQRAFAESFGRAAVGTGLTAFGITMAQLGIMTGKGERDKDYREMERQTGGGQFRINVSAFRRGVLSGWDLDEVKRKAGDLIVSYDWAQPASVTMGAGAEFGQRRDPRTPTANRGGNDLFSQMAEFVAPGTAAAEAFTVGVDTLAEQGMLRGIRQLFAGYSPAEALVSTLATAPTSFTPTLLSQVNQWADNAVRQTYDPNLAKEGINRILARLPIMAATLPQQVGVFGEPLERYQGGGNTFWNVFLNPVQMSRYLDKPEAELVKELYDATNETAQFPRVVPESLTITENGKATKYPLTPDEYRQYQESVGTLTRDAFRKLADDPQFRSAPQDQQVKILADTLSDISSTARNLLRSSSAVNAERRPKVALPPVVQEPLDAQKEDDDLLLKNKISPQEWERRYQDRAAAVRIFLTERSGINAPAAEAAAQGAYLQGLLTMLPGVTDPKERAQLLVAGWRAIPMLEKEAGIPDYDDFFAKRDAFKQALTADDRQLLETELKARMTPVVKQYEEDRELLKGYWNVTRAVSNALPAYANIQREHEEAVRTANVAAKTRIENSQIWKAYQDDVDFYKQKVRRDNPKIDQALGRWKGYDPVEQVSIQQVRQLFVDAMGINAGGRPVPFEYLSTNTQEDINAFLRQLDQVAIERYGRKFTQFRMDAPEVPQIIAAAGKPKFRQRPAPRERYTPPPPARTPVPVPELQSPTR